MDLTATTITLGSIIAIVGCIIGVLNYFTNRNKRSKNDEARLVSMEKDIQYIRLSVDNISGKLDKHEDRISRLEKKVR